MKLNEIMIDDHKSEFDPKEIRSQSRIIKYYDSDELDILYRKIVRDCSQILDIYQSAKHVIYRGENEKFAGFESTIHTDRHPRSLSIEGQKNTDAALKRAGFKTLRSNSIFCTSDVDMAKPWGDSVYIIFPLNGFEYLYSAYRDLPSNNDYMFYHLYPADVLTRGNETQEKINKVFDEIIARLKLKNEDLEWAITHKREIMISKSKYYAVRKDSLDMNRILQAHSKGR